MEWLPAATELARILLELVGAAAILASQVKARGNGPVSQITRDALHFLGQNRKYAANR